MKEAWRLEVIFAINLNSARNAKMDAENLQTINGIN